MLRTELWILSSFFISFGVFRKELLLKGPLLTETPTLKRGTLLPVTSPFTHTSEVWYSWNETGGEIDE